MKQDRVHRQRGFTLVELLAALFILALLALMSYRGMVAVMDTREQLRVESEKWRRTGAFFARFERDIRLSAPRPVLTAAGQSPAWLGRANAGGQPQLEFSRFGSGERQDQDSARRLGYRLNERGEIELWFWPGLDTAADAPAERHAVLADVQVFELRYMDSQLTWVEAWPLASGAPPIPLAVRLRIVLGSGEELVRVFALQS